MTVFASAVLRRSLYFYPLIFASDTSSQRSFPPLEGKDEYAPATCITLARTRHFIYWFSADRFLSGLGLMNFKKITP
jgi:hypothetical protein